MKFEKRFQEEIVPEWKIKYLDYKGLKKRLKNIQRTRFLSQSNKNDNKRSSDNSSYYGDSRPRSTRLEQTEISTPQVDKSYKRLSAHSQAFSMSTVAESIQDFFHKVSSALVTIQKQQDPSEASFPVQINSLDTLVEDVSPKERMFFSALDGELDKIENFYKIKEKEATARMSLLMQQYEILKEKKAAERKNEKKQSFIKQGFDYFASPNLQNTSDSKSSSTISLDGQGKIASAPLDDQQKHYKTAKQNIKKAVFEFYRGAELLRKYRVLNYNGFSKILKSYDKVTGRNGAKIYMPRVKNCYFIQSGVMKKLLKEAEDFYTDNFESGSRSQAIRKLRTPSKKNKTYYFSTLRVGIYLGFALPAFIHLIGLMIKRDAMDSTLWDSLLGLYSGFFLIIILALLFGINMCAWSMSHINYKFILELDPRNNLDFKQYLELPALFFLVMVYIMLLNFLDLISFIQPRAYPVFLIIVICAALFNPYPILYYNARKWFIFSSARLFGSGFLRVEFRDYFLADLFTSLSYSMITLQFFGCADKICDLGIYIYTPILGSIPPLFRLLQCYRRYSDTQKSIHVANLCKYGSTIISIWTTYGYHAVKGDGETIMAIGWWVSQIFSSTYTYSWDVKVDWSLLKLDSTNYLLRNELGYEHHWLYYYVIISNLFLRFSWILIRAFPAKPTVVFAVAFGEMFRRWQWNFFRVESEHVINCGEFRAVKEMPLPFQVEEVLMMGELDHEATDYDRAASLTSWSTLSKRVFSKHQARRSFNPADSWKDFEPRNNTPGYAYSENIYEDSEEEEDSYDEDEDHELGTLNARNTLVSMARIRGSLGISNAYASRSFLPINEFDNDDGIQQV